MRDDLKRRDGDSERPRRSAEGNTPLSDREVPLGGTTTTELINRWLDGEAPEPTTMRGDAARHIEFWRRIGEETERRRQVVTPAHVTAQIMQAVQTSAEQIADATPWYRRTIELSTAALLAGGAALLGLGALITSLLR